MNLLYRFMILKKGAISMVRYSWNFSWEPAKPHGIVLQDPYLFTGPLLVMWPWIRIHWSGCGPRCLEKSRIGLCERLEKVGHPVVEKDPPFQSGDIVIPLRGRSMNPQISDFGWGNFSHRYGNKKKSSTGYGSLAKGRTTLSCPSLVLSRCGSDVVFIRRTLWNSGRHEELVAQERDLCPDECHPANSGVNCPAQRKDWKQPV